MPYAIKTWTDFNEFNERFRPYLHNIIISSQSLENLHEITHLHTHVYVNAVSLTDYENVQY